MWFGPDCTSLFPHLSMFVALPDLPLHTQDILLARGGGGGKTAALLQGVIQSKGGADPPPGPIDLLSIGCMQEAYHRLKTC